MFNRRASDRESPRHVPAAGEQCGLPHDRAARIAARRAFVEMKQLFMRAADELDQAKGAWLRAQVRSTEDPGELWLLRMPLLSALRVHDGRTRALRAELYRSIDAMFAQAEPALGDDALFSLPPLPPLPDGWNVHRMHPRPRQAVRTPR